MKQLFLILLSLCTMGVSSAVAQTITQPDFDKHFEPRTLRMDFYHCGTASNEEYYFKELIAEPYWAGNHVDLIDDKEYGNHLLKVTDKATGELIYSIGFCSLFNEWQDTEEALHTQRCYPEGVVMPMPKNEVTAAIYCRDEQNKWVEKFNYEINPSSYWIRDSKPSDLSFDVHYSGNPTKKVDIVLLSEGYTSQAKFENDCAKFADEFFKYEPYKSQKDKFNIRGVWRESKEQGISLPGENMWKESALGAHYYTFDSERYQMIDDLQKVRDMAANVPYDVIYILTNSKKYGGGGIYNFYGISAAGDPNTAGKVFVHEFGHLFVGLADEYVGTTSFDGMYSKDVEPWEENLTTFVDFESKEWYSMLDKKTPVPTPDVEKYDSTLGVYEGGGYQKEGVYRPWRNCLMRVLHTTDIFCPVCTATINHRIDKLTR